MLLVVLLCLTAPFTPRAATADDTPWRIDFGPYLGHYDFDAITGFEDGPVVGLRLGIHSGGWFRFEAEFDEVYTRRLPAENAARQPTLAAHGRFEPQSWRLAPSAMIGIAYVMLDDSDFPDAFGEAWDMGLGLSWRVSDSWRLRGEFMARYQKFRVRDPELPPEDPESRSEPMGLWARSWRLGASWALPEERDGQAVHYPVDLALYAGYWSFDSAFRYEDDAVFGLRGTVGMASWMTLQLELDQITTSNKRSNDWAQAVSFAMHGLFELRGNARWRPGVLAGVAFMGMDNRQDFDAISEGFDLGPSLRLKGSGRLGLQADVLFRYQSVRINPVDENGLPIADSAVDYVWSYGARLGVSVEL